MAVTRHFIIMRRAGWETAGAIVFDPGAGTTAEGLKQYVKDRVAPYKYPRMIKIMNELPKTAA
ncbi:MAG: hypothetical protein K4571_04685 [Deltaproteobacteria bacterium]